MSSTKSYFVKLLLLSFIVLFILIQRRNAPLKVSKRAQSDSGIPVDVVITWVNGSDPKWLENFNRLKNPRTTSFNLSRLPRLSEALGSFRFADNGELRYAFRSIATYAPWIRRIFLVTNGQIPTWLRLDHPRVTIVTHVELFRDLSSLPTFNSNAIEKVLHRIPGLSRLFIYMNDDFFFVSPSNLADFYNPKTGIIIRMGHQVPNCDSKCQSLRNGPCYVSCTVRKCAREGGPCYNTQSNLLADTHLAAMLFTDRLLTRRYGVDGVRYSLPHAPLMYSRDVMLQMEENFRDDMSRTESNHFRQPDDVQTALLYNYFAIKERVDKSPSQFLSQFDFDDSGTLETVELQSLSAITWPSAASNFERFMNLTAGCITSHARTLHLSISFDVLLDCEPFLHEIKHQLIQVPIAKHQIQLKPDHLFWMITAKDTTLNFLKRAIFDEGWKFLCVNDNIDHQNTDIQKQIEIQRITRELFNALFPERSEFEVNDNLVQGI